LATYPKPPNTAISPVFSLKIDGTSVPVMKYMDYHYAHFAFDGTITVTVSAPHAVSSHTFSPVSLAIQAKVSGGDLTFSMTQVKDTDSTPRYLVVQINALEKLVLLGDPPESGVPSSSGTGIFNVVNQYGADPTGATYTQPDIQKAIDAASSYGTRSRPGIVYVPPGIYMVHAELLLKDNVDLYLAPGAVLKADENMDSYSVSSGGTIAPVLVIDDASNVTIRGRGEVDASGIALMDLLSQVPPIFLSQSKPHPRRRIIQSNRKGASRNVEISGILAKDATGWSVDLVKTNGVVVQNVKVLNHKDVNWNIQNDGINATSSSNALINQCFVMTIDDAMCSKARYKSVGSMDNVAFANNVLWTWAAGVKGGMQNNHPMNNVVFRNIDIVHCRRAIAVDAKTSQDNGQTIPIQNVEFHDIRVDEIEGHWKISRHDAMEFLLEDAPAHNIRVTNFTCPKKRPLRCGPAYSANGVTFQNFVMEGELITDVTQVELEGEQPIENLVFTIDDLDSGLTDEQKHKE